MFGGINNISLGSIVSRLENTSNIFVVVVVWGVLLLFFFVSCDLHIFSVFI